MKQPKSDFSFSLNSDSAFPTEEEKKATPVVKSKKAKAKPKKIGGKVKKKQISVYLTEGEYETYLDRLDGRSASATARDMILNYES